VSRAERGHAGGLRLNDVERMAAALGARLEVRLWWHGEAVDRLLDAAHASLVESIVARLRAAGWIVETEITFDVRGERGSIDVLAWHPPYRTLLVVEVKSAFGDIQATLVTLDRKARLGPLIARRRFGWEVQRTARILVVADTRTNRRVVERHAALFASAFPVRSRAVASWLRQPVTTVSGLLFVSSDAYSSIRRSRRVRRRGLRPAACSETTPPIPESPADPA
jgi:hypothetical protein